jgi:predicted dinucleotide-binding enzyme
VKVAILGGTGRFGSALARRLTEAGVEVTIGSRDPERAAAAAADTGAARGLSNEDSVQDADLVVMACEASSALSMVADLATPIGETPVLSVASQLRIENGAAVPGDDPLSLAEQMQHLLRGPVVAGLHSLAAKSHLVSGRALDAGPLASARALEGMTAVIVNLNRRYRGHAGLRVEGL